jgi:hypothetical protein
MDILYKPEYAEIVNRSDDVLMEEESAVAVGNATGVSPRRLAEARRLCALSWGSGSFGSVSMSLTGCGNLAFSLSVSFASNGKISSASGSATGCHPSGLCLTGGIGASANGFSGSIGASASVGACCGYSIGVSGGLKGTVSWKGCISEISVSMSAGGTASGTVSVAFNPKSSCNYNRWLYNVSVSISVSSYWTSWPSTWNIVCGTLR